MNRKLFVGGLSWNTTDEILRQTFSPFGQITSTKIITDRETGKSRGFGFIEYDTDESAKSAVKALHGSVLDGRTIRVEISQNTGARRTGGHRTRDTGNRYPSRRDDRFDRDRGEAPRAQYSSGNRGDYPYYGGRDCGQPIPMVDGNRALPTTDKISYDEDDDNRGNC